MKLSVAMVLGSTIGPLRSSDINSCALGAAANAVGIPEHIYTCDRAMTDRYDAIGERWPWLARSNNQRMLEIIKLFDVRVSDGDMTFEQLVAYVRSVEPECESCCDRDCCCEIPATQTLQPKSVTSCV